MSQPINSEVLAIGLAQMAEPNPERIEALWFIQSQSLRSGGLRALAKEIIAAAPEHIGTQTMRKLQARPQYKAADCIAVWKEIPVFVRGRFINDWRIELEISGDDSVERIDLRCLPPDVGEEGFAHLRDQITQHNKAEFETLCRKLAEDELPSALARICNQETCDGEETSTWYIALWSALRSYMKQHAAKAAKRLAMTAVAREVFDALDYAWSEKVMVHVEGDPRFGKTEALETWCAMYPGRARLVSVPCSNSDADLYKAVADAFGVPYAPNTRASDIKAKVEYVVRHSGLLMVFDEAHFLIPSRYSIGTPPMRLNWIRTEIIDKDVPVALVTTPQSFSKPLAQFVKKTGHTIEQFLGRTMLKKLLPNELDASDLVAVAKVHFPEFDEDVLELIAAKAMQSELYLKAVEAIAKRARYLARQDRAEVSIEHIDRAAAEIIPAPVVCAPAKPVFKGHLKRNAEALQGRCIQPISRAPESENGRLAIAEPDLADV